MASVDEDALTALLVEVADGVAAVDAVDDDDDGGAVAEEEVEGATAGQSFCT